MAIYKLTIAEIEGIELDEPFIDLNGRWEVERYGLEMIVQEKESCYAVKDGSYPDLPEWLNCERQDPIDIESLREHLDFIIKGILKNVEREPDKYVWITTIHHNPVETTEEGEHTPSYQRGNLSTHVNIYEGRTKAENIELNNKAKQKTEA